jgi:hypothetical protein
LGGGGRGRPAMQKAKRVDRARGVTPAARAAHETGAVPVAELPSGYHYWPTDEDYAEVDRSIKEGYTETVDSWSLGVVLVRGSASTPRPLCARHRTLLPPPPSLGGGGAVHLLVRHHAGVV